MSRPPLTNQPIALGLIWLLAICGAVAVILASGLISEGALAITAGTSLALLLHLANSTSPGGRAAASIGTIVVGVFLTGAIGLAAVAGFLAGELFVTLAITIALVLTAWSGAGAATTGLDSAATRDALRVLIVTAVPIAPYLVILIHTMEGLGREGNDSAPVAAGMLTDRFGELIEVLISPDANLIGALSLGLLVLAVLVTIAYTVPRLTILSLFGQSNREPIETAFERLRKYCIDAIVYGVFALLVAGVVFIVIAVIRLNFPAWQDDLDSVIDLVAEILFAVGGSEELRWLLLIIAAVFWAGWLLSAIPAVSRMRHHPLGEWSSTAIGGLGVIVGIHFGYPALFDRLIEPGLHEYGRAHHLEPEFPHGEVISVEDLTILLSPPVGQAAAAAAIIAILALVFLFIATITLLKRVGVIRERGATGSIAGSALIGAALVLGIDGASVLAIGVLLVLGIAIWDLTRYADGLLDELGSAPTAVAPILVHGVGTVVMGVLLLALVVGIEYRPIEIEPALRTPVAGLLAIALVLFFIALNLRSKRLAR